MFFPLIILLELLIVRGTESTDAVNSVAMDIHIFFVIICFVGIVAYLCMVDNVFDHFPLFVRFCYYLTCPLTLMFVTWDWFHWPLWYLLASTAMKSPLTALALWVWNKGPKINKSLNGCRFQDTAQLGTANLEKYSSIDSTHLRARRPRHGIVFFEGKYKWLFWTYTECFVIDLIGSPEAGLRLRIRKSDVIPDPKIKAKRMTGKALKTGVAKLCENFGEYEMGKNDCVSFANAVHDLCKEQ